MTGIELIVAERKRQIGEEGWDADHDSRHENDELSWAAICYAAPNEIKTFRSYNIWGCGCREADCGCPNRVITKTGWKDPWPWDELYDKRKKHDRLKRLIIAGALIAAEIDRLSG